jgi:hypothetical protein
MNNWYGNFVDNEIVYMTFNTFNSDGASVTATIVDGDIEVYKDGGTTELATNGATVQKDFDGVTGTHQITIDTSASGDYAIGSDYSVRVGGITVDTQIINAFVGTLSIENRFMRGTDGSPTVSEILDGEVDNDGTAISLEGACKLMLSVLTGKSSGGGGNPLVFRNINDDKNVISVTADGNGNRTAVGIRDAT